MKDNSSYFYLVSNLGVGLLLTASTLVLMNRWFGIENLWALVVLGVLVFGIMVTLEEKFLSKYINRIVQYFLKNNDQKDELS
jgi:hypothetical protein